MYFICVFLNTQHVFATYEFSILKETFNLLLNQDAFQECLLVAKHFLSFLEMQKYHS